MKFWLVFVLVTICCWGAYVPTLHHGQHAFGGKGGAALRAFLFVGLAYFIVSAAVLAYMVAGKVEPLVFTNKGMSVSTLAGIAGAIGALGIVFAIKNGGKPLLVAPLVFAGAPIMNTFVSMMWDKPVRMPDWRFFLGIVLAGVGAAMVLRFKPETADARHATQIKTVTTVPEQTTT